MRASSPIIIINHMISLFFHVYCVFIRWSNKTCLVPFVVKTWCFFFHFVDLFLSLLLLAEQLLTFLYLWFFVKLRRLLNVSMRDTTSIWMTLGKGLRLVLRMGLGRGQGDAASFRALHPWFVTTLLVWVFGTRFANSLVIMRGLLRLFRVFWGSVHLHVYFIITWFLHFLI